MRNPLHAYSFLSVLRGANVFDALKRRPIGIAAMTVVLSVTFLPSAHANDAPAPPTNDECLTCHADDAGTLRANGQPVVLKADVFAASVHGAGGMTCVDCHADLASGAELPHAEKLKPVECDTCHSDAVAAYNSGVHAQARRSGQNLTAATCVDCHGTHDIRPSTDPESRTHHSNLINTCGRCHGDEAIIKRGNIQIGNVVELFKDSIHGRALIRSGLTVAPACTDCHGNHDIRRKTDPSSRVYRDTVPLTCGKCHEGIVRDYWTSIHGTEVQAKNPLAPVCSNCHTAHDISRVDVEAWKVGVIEECGACHEESIRTYRDTFHGQVTALGYARVAACADCHGSHTIVPEADPRSTINVANRVTTCKKCHEGATASFAQYDPHADASNRSRNPALFYISRFMRTLVVGVFLFFGVHTGLWLGRGVQLKAATRLRGQGGNGSKGERP